MNVAAPLHVFIISLDSKRLEQVKARIRAAWGEHNVVCIHSPGVRCTPQIRRHLRTHTNRTFRQKLCNVWLPDSATGIFMAHRSAWKAASVHMGKSRDMNPVLIVEDDIVIETKFDWNELVQYREHCRSRDVLALGTLMLGKRQKTAIEQWFMHIYLAMSWEDIRRVCEVKEEVRIVKDVAAGIGMHAYLISAQALEKLLHQQNFNVPSGFLDIQLYHCPNLQVDILVPSLIHQEDFAQSQNLASLYKKNRQQIEKKSLVVNDPETIPIKYALHMALLKVPGCSTNLSILDVLTFATFVVILVLVTITYRKRFFMNRIKSLETVK